MQRGIGIGASRIVEDAGDRVATTCSGQGVPDVCLLVLYTRALFGS